MTWIEAIKEEKEQLDDKLNNLELFLRDEVRAIHIVGEWQFDLLNEQYESMSDYSNILELRIIDGEQNEAN